MSKDSYLNSLAENESSGLRRLHSESQKSSNCEGESPLKQDRGKSLFSKNKQKVILSKDSPGVIIKKVKRNSTSDMA